MDPQSRKIRIRILQLGIIARNASYYLALDEYQKELKQNYWIAIYNNYIDIVTLEWCKIFGSKKEQTHWKTVVDDPVDFEKDLLSAVKMTSVEWNKYRDETRQYRDKFLAHYDERHFEVSPGQIKIPDLEGILQSSNYFYIYLVKKFRKLQDGAKDEFPNDLLSYYEASLKQAKDYVKAAFGATKALPERVL
jgi:hypothetical protein